MQKIITLLSTTIICSSLHAQDQWVNIFYNADDIMRVVSNPCDSINKIEYLDNGEYGCTRMSINLNNGKSKDLPIKDIVFSGIGQNVISMYIDVLDGKEITSKEDYLQAHIRIDGNEDIEGLNSTSVSIKGRGNSTWGYPKKPYRLKFDKKISIGGLKKAKSFVLLANYIDNTLMRNALSFKMAQLLGMPYTNHSTPVNLYINGFYHGSYLLTEKIGLNSASIDISDDTGFLLELDTHYDEDYKFISYPYELPVMVKDPDLYDVYGEDGAEYIFQSLKADFESLLQSICEHNMDRDRIDLESIVNYLIVFNLSLNYELVAPRSIYMYCTSLGGKYFLGPVWDFDWAYTYHTKEYPDCYNNILISGNKPVDKFWFDLMEIPGFWEEYARKWKIFYDELAPMLLEYMNNYYHEIRVSAYQNGEIWPQSTMEQNAISTETFDQNFETLYNWLTQRIQFLNNHPKFGLCND